MRACDATRTTRCGARDMPAVRCDARDAVRAVHTMRRGARDAVHAVRCTRCGAVRCGADDATRCTRCDARSAARCASCGAHSAVRCGAVRRARLAVRTVRCGAAAQRCANACRRYRDLDRSQPPAPPGHRERHVLRASARANGEERAARARRGGHDLLTAARLGRVASPRARLGRGRRRRIGAGSAGAWESGSAARPARRRALPVSWCAASDRGSEGTR